MDNRDFVATRPRPTYAAPAIMRGLAWLVNSPTTSNLAGTQDHREARQDVGRRENPHFSFRQPRSADLVRKNPRPWQPALVMVGFATPTWVLYLYTQLELCPKLPLISWRCSRNDLSTQVVSYLCFEVFLGGSCLTMSPRALKPKGMPVLCLR